MDKTRVMDSLLERLAGFESDLPSNDRIVYEQNAQQWEKTLYLLRILYEKIGTLYPDNPVVVRVRNGYSDAWDIRGPTTFEHRWDS